MPSFMRLMLRLHHQQALKYSCAMIPTAAQTLEYMIFYYDDHFYSPLKQKIAGPTNHAAAQHDKYRVQLESP